MQQPPLIRRLRFLPGSGAGPHQRPLLRQYNRRKAAPEQL